MYFFSGERMTGSDRTGIFHIGIWGHEVGTPRILVLFLNPYLFRNHTANRY